MINFTASVTSRGVTTQRLLSVPRPGGSTPLSSLHPSRTTDIVIPAGTDFYLDAPAEVRHLTVFGTLRLGGGLTLDAYANVIARGNGQITSLPDPRVQFTIRGVNEGAMVGGGMDPVESDLGIWIMDNASMSLAGAPVTGKARLAGTAAVGATALTLDRIPVGWRVGGRIVVTPTAPTTQSNFYDQFDVRVIAGLSGNVVTLTQPLQYTHPVIDPSGLNITAAVLYLERDVVIGGTTTGRSHVFIRSTRPQTIRNVKFQDLGPRRDVSTNVLGRWAVHFHHCMEASRGSLVEGCLLERCGSWGFVPHMSNGVTFSDCHGYDGLEEFFRWDDREPDDEPSISEDVSYAGCTAAKIRAPRARFLLSGFPMQRGERNRCTNCEVVGMGSSPGQDLSDCIAFKWDEFMSGVWAFDGCLAYNNQAIGMRNWKNDDRPHLLQNFRLANHVPIVNPSQTPRQGILHGAYLNAFQFRGGRLYGNCIVLHAVSDRDHLQNWNDMTVDMAGLGPDAVLTATDLGSQQLVFVPTVLRNFHVRGYTRAGFRVSGPPAFTFSLALMDLVGWTFEANAFWLDSNCHASTAIRVQDCTGPGLSPGDTLLLRRQDQPGVLNTAWNCRVTVIPRFA